MTSGRPFRLKAYKHDVDALVERWAYLDATDDARRCRWPECNCYSPQGPHACRRAIEDSPTYD